jgi:hypothetical protein
VSLANTIPRPGPACSQSMRSSRSTSVPLHPPSLRATTTSRPVLSFLHNSTGERSTCSRTPIISQIFGMRNYRAVKFLCKRRPVTLLKILYIARVVSTIYMGLYSYHPFLPRGALMRRHWRGERFGARGRGSLPRTLDGTGHRLRPLRAGARSSLTERLYASRKARPGPRNRRAGAPQGVCRREGGRKARCARRRSGPLVLTRLAFTPFVQKHEGSRISGRAKKRGRGNDEGWLFVTPSGFARFLDLYLCAA